MRRLRHLGVCRVAVRVRLMSVCMSGPLEFCVSVSSWFCVLHGGNEKDPEDSGVKREEGDARGLLGSLLSCFGAARQASKSILQV